MVYLVGYGEKIPLLVGEFDPGLGDSFHGARHVIVPAQGHLKECVGVLATVTISVFPGEVARWPHNITQQHNSRYQQGQSP